MTDQPTTCRAEYQRPSGPLPGDRIVRCDFPPGHRGDHEEADTGNTWTNLTAEAGEPTADCDYDAWGADFGVQAGARCLNDNPEHQRQHHPPQPSEPTTDPRAAQIEAVRDLLLCAVRNPDNPTEADTERLAHLLVDAVLSAGACVEDCVLPLGHRGEWHKDQTGRQWKPRDAVHAAGRDGQGERGICGSPSPQFFANTAPNPCVLLAEHPGWHHGQDGSDWSYADGPSEDYQAGRTRGRAETWANAVEALTDADRYRAWWRQVDSTDDDFVRMPYRRALARYLDAVGADGTPDRPVCTCPDADLTQFDGPPRVVKGRDPNCPTCRKGGDRG